MQGTLAIVLLGSLFILCVSASVGTSSYTATDYQNSFTAWQQQFKKAYRPNEFWTRFTNYKETLDYIRAHNSANHSYTLGTNEFSDLTVEEFRSLLLFTIPPIPASEGLAQHTDEGHTTRAASVDWRTSGAVQAIKNQGNCGSCWTFATAASIESITKIKTNVLPSLSEQNLLDCVTQYNSGCGGGSPYYATTYVINNKGIDTEASYAYTAAKGTCQYNAANSAATITGVKQVTSGSESALQSAVSIQPVSVAIDASLQTFQSYKSGTYSDASCSSSVLNHAVLVIGYGTDSNGDYWLVKNSWGTWWGNQGFFQLARNAGNRCGVATQAIYPTKS